MPTGGRRSKPSPRFFEIGGRWFRGLPGRGAGVNTGVPLLARHLGWLAFRFRNMYSRIPCTFVSCVFPAASEP